MYPHADPPVAEQLNDTAAAIYSWRRWSLCRVVKLPNGQEIEEVTRVGPRGELALLVNKLFYGKKWVYSVGWDIIVLKCGIPSRSAQE